MGIQWYIYINIYPYKLWSILDVTCDQQEASAAVTWKNMEPLKRVFALGRFGSKIWDYPGPKALPKKKNILLEFLTTNPKKSGSETLKITRSEQNCVTTCSQQIDAMGLPSIRIASTYWCLVNYILFFKMLCFIFGKQLFNPELWLQPLGC